jgi:hypothetical protein
MIRNGSVKEKTETTSRDALLLFGCLLFVTVRGHDCYGRPISSSSIGSGWLGVALSVPKPLHHEICNSGLFLYISQFLYLTNVVTAKGFCLAQICQLTSPC